MKKAKCYKKSEVKVWFGRLENADKYWLESFRDYTKCVVSEMLKKEEKGIM